MSPVPHMPIKICAESLESIVSWEDFSAWNQAGDQVVAASTGTMFTDEKDAEAEDVQFECQWKPPPLLLQKPAPQSIPFPAALAFRDTGSRCGSDSSGAGASTTTPPSSPGPAPDTAESSRFLSSTLPEVGPPGSWLHSVPSLGSAKHGSGRCMPCAWHWKPGGCSHGSQCGFCHSCPKGELKTRKKEKIAAMRLNASTSLADNPAHEIPMQMHPPISLSSALCL
eukprot:gnl/TRDRNA2_/TRDRNA2_83408_c0_seq1.p1 gnl/TRDRNA2_/TRDRNA2_83408_c0~~gnl/TRDRNA2_/TRDRNA2_83408_c0_seq1.p1  ORF type:complete len:225 (+),score=25.99 gnl/TRDRNA2_/TRDRNA2_83408_c0_seq1:67-741(+)